jgi:hypothetical protein
MGRPSLSSSLLSSLSLSLSSLHYVSPLLSSHVPNVVQLSASYRLADQVTLVMDYFEHDEFRDYYTNLTYDETSACKEKRKEEVRETEG